MERFVHCCDAARGAGKGGDEGFRRLAAALEAGAVPGGEGGRLVEEKQLRVILAPDVAAPSLEFADANEPVLGLPAAAAQSPIVAMQPPAAITHEAAAVSDRAQFAEGIDAILQRARCFGHAAWLEVAFHARQVHASKLSRLWGEETWRSNFGRIANIATRTCRLPLPTRASAASNARSAPIASSGI